MRVLLAANASYAPPRGGSTRGNLVWLHALSAGGHECRVICPAAEDGPPSESVVYALSSGISVRSVPELSRRPGVLAAEIHSFAPDWALVSSEDLSHVLLREAHRVAPDRLVYLAHTPQFFPFGSESWNPDPRAAEIVKRARAVVAIGEHMAGYIEAALGLRPHVIHPPIYGAGPWPNLASFNTGFALMINPCEVKGIGVFLDLAMRFPDRQFAALAGWGTTSRDRASLARLPNVKVLEAVPDIEDVLRHARLLLMPSLWYEGFGLIVMEAMLRGLPVIASDSGGLVEAKRGTGFIIPVQPVERYLPEFDENHMPKPVNALQSIEPWAEALDALDKDRSLYGEESRRSREAALRFVSGLRAGAFEEMLISLTHAQPETAREPASPVERLSPERRALLLRRLRGNTRR
jgi:glycosyltransferase involved in cell wall biosynthesis